MEIKLLYGIITVLICIVSANPSAKKDNKFKPPDIAPSKEYLKKNNFQRWLKQQCPAYASLTKMRHVMNVRLTKRVDKMAFNEEIPAEVRKAQIDTLMIFMKEMNETDILLTDSFKWMDDVMRGDYNNFASLKKSSEQRLESLREATLKEEQEYDILLKAEENLQELNHSQIAGIMDDILMEVAEAADQLDELLDDHVFENAINNADQVKPNIQAVIKLEENHESAINVNASKRELDAAGGGEVIKLVDAQDNQFVMSKGKDSTVPHEDQRFIADLVNLMVCSFVCGWLCSIVHLPTMFGYVVGGIIVGPSGFNILKSLVQLETLGEFGVFFILFTVGLEFSPTNLKKVFKVATLGTMLMTALMIICGLLVGYVLNSSWNESCFVAACLSLSSTPLVIKFLNPGNTDADTVGADNRAAEGPAGTDYGTVLLGILIMQDVLLGLLMAMLPNMAAPITTATGSAGYVYSMVGLQLAGALLMIIIASYAISRWILSPFFTFLRRQGNKEVIVLASAAVAFVTMMATEYLHVSMELGCFVAGVMLSSHALTEEIEALVTPVKDFLACIFFASIGLHVFPTFLLYELTILTTFTMTTVAAKYAICVFVLHFLVPAKSSHIKWIVSAGLSQVSEFSFVLASRARQLGLISREVYLLILSVTTCSLLFAPVLWKVTLYQLRVRAKPTRPTRNRSEISLLHPHSNGEISQQELAAGANLSNVEVINSNNSSPKMCKKRTQSNEWEEQKL